MYVALKGTEGLQTPKWLAGGVGLLALIILGLTLSMGKAKLPS